MSAGPQSAAIMQVDDLHMAFKRPRSTFDRLTGKPMRIVHALNGVSFQVARGETLGIVGESGCGKSTLARCLVRLYEPLAGRIRYDGLDVLKLQGKARREYNRRVQMVFQDPYGSLNPRMTVRQTLAEAISFHRLREGTAVAARVSELLGLVRLPNDAADRYPHEFSGGQRQRIGIARALAVEPDCLIADELVSALDVSVQAQIINLLLELQQKLHLTVLFIAHDLRLIRHISHRVAVMYLGSIVELAETETLFNSPAHPYTEALLKAAPELDPARRSVIDAVRGELPSPLALPVGCPFHPRCPYAMDRCRGERPVLRPRGEKHEAACHLHDGALASAARTGEELAALARQRSSA
ncbi:MAG TPA: oligopeptide/dipeptide ABC transporter ATP-binding protein [Dongiaceae bacterium]|jgi:oligopeptide/dipeptide ABC transporter ATP-binding protein|nr:oligopeptide/dipeptide ABC transporter ATP-binding protein [Dongiaceae bacterium]